jgi:hypothetical protein
VAGRGPAARGCWSRRVCGHLADRTALTDARLQPQAERELKGTPITKAQLAAQPGKTQQLRYTGSYGATSFVVNAPEGDPATVYAHHSIWPRKVDIRIHKVCACVNKHRESLTTDMHQFTHAHIHACRELQRARQTARQPDTQALDYTHTHTHTHTHT